MGCIWRVGLLSSTRLVSFAMVRQRTWCGEPALTKHWGCLANGLPDYLVGCRRVLVAGPIFLPSWVNCVAWPVESVVESVGDRVDVSCQPEMTYQ